MAADHLPGDDPSANGIPTGDSVTPTWVDVPVSADQPVEVALLKHFLRQNGFHVTESRHHLSIGLDDIDRLVACVQIWALDRENMLDPRNPNTLDATLYRLGYRLLEAAEKHRPMRSAPEPSVTDERIEGRTPFVSASSTDDEPAPRPSGDPSATGRSDILDLR